MTLNQYKMNFLNCFIDALRNIKYYNRDGKFVIDFDDLEYMRDILNKMLKEEDEHESL